MKFKCRSPTLTNKIQNKWDKYWKANWIFICEAKVKRMEDWAGGWALPRIVAQRNFVHLARGNKKSWVREKDKGSRVRLLFEQHSILCQNGHTHVWAAPTQSHFMRVATFLLFMFDRFSCWYVKHADSQWLQLLCCCCCCRWGRCFGLPIAGTIPTAVPPHGHHLAWCRKKHNESR